jgi:hypothetical protein
MDTQYAPNANPKDIEEIWTHKWCPDGTASLTCAALYQLLYNGGKKLKFVYLNHGDTIPSAKDKKIVVFDFAFDDETTKRLLSEARQISIYDHHRGQQSVMEKYPSNCFFNNEHSAAFLAWEFFFKGKPIPKWIQYVEDKDLGRFTKPDVMAFSLYLFYLPDQTPETWIRYIYPKIKEIILAVLAKLLLTPESSAMLTEATGGANVVPSSTKDDCSGPPKHAMLDLSIMSENELFNYMEMSVPYSVIIERGNGYIEIQKKLIEMQLQGFKKIRFCGVNAGIANVTLFISETCSEFLSKNPDCVLVISPKFNFETKKTEISLRSIRNPNQAADQELNQMEDKKKYVECHEIAKLFGGNGHQPAAAFKLDMTKNLDQFITDNMENEQWLCRKPQ